MKKINFRGWELIVDREATKLAYDTTAFGGTDNCECSYCQNFSNNKENIYPNEIRALFDQLGIDYRKECEAWHYCKDDLGRHCYSGWFHFKGDFKGEECIDRTSESTSTMNLIPINENFSIGFCYNNQLAFFADKDGLVQVEFDAKTQWMIDISLESD